MPAQRASHRQATAGAADQESESDSESAARGPGRDPGRQQDGVFCPACKGRFHSLYALSCHRNSSYRTACGQSWLRQRRHRVSLRPGAAAPADDSDWTDPDIRDMMGDGNGHDLPAGAGRGEALPSRDRVSAPHPKCSARARSEPAAGPRTRSEPARASRPAHTKRAGLRTRSEPARAQGASRPPGRRAL